MPCPVNPHTAGPAAPHVFPSLWDVRVKAGDGRILLASKTCRLCGHVQTWQSDTILEVDA